MFCQPGYDFFQTQYQQQISGTKDLYDSLPKHIIAYFIN